MPSTNPTLRISIETKTLSHRVFPPVPFALRLLWNGTSTSASTSQSRAPPTTLAHASRPLAVALASHRIRFDVRLMQRVPCAPGLGLDLNPPPPDARATGHELLTSIPLCSVCRRRQAAVNSNAYFRLTHTTTGASSLDSNGLVSQTRVLFSRRYGRGLLTPGYTRN